MINIELPSVKLRESSLDDIKQSRTIESPRVMKGILRSTFLKEKSPGKKNPMNQTLYAEEQLRSPSSNQTKKLPRTENEREQSISLLRTVNPVVRARIKVKRNDAVTYS